ncbi:hypothetical protein B0H21DRAFT_96338 [Amylocystis lapponica]|nr:hypothetical protein B0H21DRAFT_96338 [Amylocystis lapponica]
MFTRYSVTHWDITKCLYFYRIMRLPTSLMVHGRLTSILISRFVLNLRQWDSDGDTMYTTSWELPDHFASRIVGNMGAPLRTGSSELFSADNHESTWMPDGEDEQPSLASQLPEVDLEIADAANEIEMSVVNVEGRSKGPGESGGPRSDSEGASGKMSGDQGLEAGSVVTHG